MTNVKTMLKSPIPLVVSGIFRTFVSVMEKCNTQRPDGLYLKSPVLDHTESSVGRPHEINRKLTSLYMEDVVSEMQRRGHPYVRGIYMMLVIDAGPTGRIRSMRIVPELAERLDDGPETQWPDMGDYYSAAASVLSRRGYPPVTESEDGLIRFYERLKEDVPEIASHVEDRIRPSEYVLVHPDSRRFVSPDGELVAEDCKAEAFSSIGEAMKKSAQYGKKFLTHLRVYARARP
mgnify:CR=1 FL=1